MNRRYTIITLIALVLTGCGNNPPQPEQMSERGKELVGPHLLRQIGTNLTESASFHGG
jgi:PBP1b-binding outer membrane lipoprotein LpoB